MQGQRLEGCKGGVYGKGVRVGCTGMVRRKGIREGCTGWCTGMRYGMVHGMVHGMVRGKGARELFLYDFSVKQNV